MSNHPPWSRNSKNVIIFQMRHVVLTLLTRSKASLFRGKKKLINRSEFPENGSKLFVYLWRLKTKQNKTKQNKTNKKNNSLHSLRRLLLKISKSQDVSRSECHRSLFNLWQLTFLTSYLLTWHFRKCKLFFSEYPQANKQFAAIFMKIGATLMCYLCTIRIFTFILLCMGSLWCSYFKLLSVFYVRIGRRIRNSKTIATMRDLHVPGLTYCSPTRLLWVLDETNFWKRNRIRVTSPLRF